MFDWKRTFARLKYHYDLSASFLGLINFMLLSITASVPIRDFMAARLGIMFDQFVIVGLLCVLLVASFLLFGMLLDTKMQYFENLTTIQNQKNPQITEILENTRKMLGRER